MKNFNASLKIQEHKNRVESYYAQVDDSAFLRKDVLENTKALLTMLKGAQAVRLIKEEKLLLARELKKTFDDIARLNRKLCSKLPSEAIQFMHTSQIVKKDSHINDITAHSNFSSDVSSNSPSSADSVSSVQKQKLIIPKKSRIEQLEEELSSIERKLNSLQE